MASEPEGLSARGVSFSYGNTGVLRAVDLVCRRGQNVALAGPNGSGKTTLLSLLAAERRPSSGTIVLDGRKLDSMAARERARRIAVVPQQSEAGLTFRVRELVAMGRAPHVGFLGNLSRRDETAVEDALGAADIVSLADRRFSELSGGEQQRVALAMALAQETDYLLLDEPTVHLDLAHQHEMLELLDRLRYERRLGVVAVMHDLNLSALYFDTLTVLNGGQVVASGSSASLVADEHVLAVFRAPLARVSHPDGGVPQVLLRRRESS